jgi:hypothetical protein
MRAASATYVLVWRRESNTATQVENELCLPIAPSHTEAHPRLLYPQHGALLNWNTTDGELRVSLPRCPSACLIAFDSALPVRSWRSSACVTSVQ